MRYIDPDGMGVDNPHADGHEIIEIPLDFNPDGLKRFEIDRSWDDENYDPQQKDKQGDEGKGKKDKDSKENKGEVEPSANNRNSAQDKILTRGDIKNLQEQGSDHHDKGDHGGQTDLWKDKEGNVYQKPKNGQGPGEPIGYKLSIQSNDTGLRQTISNMTGLTGVGQRPIKFFYFQFIVSLV